MANHIPKMVFVNNRQIPHCTFADERLRYADYFVYPYRIDNTNGSAITKRVHGKVRIHPL